MPNIKPISDLRNYTEVLQDVAAEDMRAHFRARANEE